MGDLAALFLYPFPLPVGSSGSQGASCPGSGASRPTAAPAPGKGALGSRVGLDAEPMDTHVPVGEERRGGLGAGTSGVISRVPSRQPVLVVLGGRGGSASTTGLASKPPLAPSRGWGSCRRPRSWADGARPRARGPAEPAARSGALPRACREYVRWREGDLSPSTFPWG